MSDDHSQRKKSWLGAVKLAVEAWKKLEVGLSCGSHRECPVFSASGSIGIKRTPGQVKNGIIV